MLDVGRPGSRRKTRARASLQPWVFTNEHVGQSPPLIVRKDSFNFTLL